MFLSDMRYLAIRNSLRQVLRDSRDRIEKVEDFSEQSAEKGRISQDFLNRYMNGMDYPRANVFYNAIRNLRQNSFQIPYIGITYISKKDRVLIMQAETFAKEIKEIRRI